MSSSRRPSAAGTPTNEQLSQAVFQLTTQMQEMATTLANLANNQAANAGNNNQAAANNAISFSLSPGTASVEDIIDYSTKQGSSLYEQGKSALPTPFNLKQQEVVVFEKELASKAKEMGWSKGEQAITIFNDANNNKIDLISQYGQLTMDQIKQQCQAFISPDQPKSQQRAAQNNEMMWRCLAATVSGQAKTTLLSYRKEYEVTIDGQQDPVTVAPLMYKVIMRLATLDTRATNSALRSNLRELTAYAVKVGGDIDKLHSYFDQNYSQLTARGQTVDDVMDILFDAYTCGVSDADFVNYMKKKRDDRTEQANDMVDATHTKLMQLAKAKFDYLVSKGMWGAQSAEQQELTALKAEINQLKGNNLKLSTQLTNAVKSGGSSGSNNQNANQSKNKSGDGPKTKNKKNTSNKRRQKEDEAWKKIPPKDNEPKTKQVGKKTWNWCVHHMSWTVHKENECKLGLANKQSNGTQQKQVANMATTTEEINEQYTAMLAQFASMSTQADESWFAPAWPVLLHGFLTMAEPPNINLTLAYLFLAVGIIWLQLLCPFRFSDIVNSFWPYRRHRHFPTTLLFATIFLFKVGCRVLHFLSAAHRFVAYQSGGLLRVPPWLTGRFDSDSYPIGVDNHCSRCMSGNKQHFEDLLLNGGTEINGIGSGLTIAGRGTFTFRIEDDSGSVSTIRIPNSLFVPGLKTPLLSPQHWAQEANDHQPTPKGTRMENDDEECRLIWDQGRRIKTIKHSPLTNTPTFWTAADASIYRAFETITHRRFPPTTDEHVRLIDDPFSTMEAFVAEENINVSERFFENEGANRTHLFPEDIPSSAPCPLHPTAHHKWGDCRLRNKRPRHDRLGALTFSPDPATLSEEYERQNDNMAATNNQSELMRWHYRLGHLPFDQIKQLARNKEIPSKLANIPPPRCAGCLFGAMTKVPWRDKSKNNKRSIHQVKRAGECVSVDQLVSTQVGFIAQMKGQLTRKRYTAATIFVDHFSRLRFVALMTTLSSAETIRAKETFEQFAANHGVSIKHYHADNGRFADNAFVTHCEQRRQQLTFCGVNAHFQNGIAERAIRDVTEMARKQLLHAKARWPGPVHLALWPYALRNAVHLYNSVPSQPDGSSRIERFSSVNAGFRMKDNHTFGCPVFALQNALAAGSTIPKWSPRARMGMNLGPSPYHARNVNLILNLETGLVSPQFHCRYDDFFETVQLGQAEVVTSSTWQVLAGLKRPDRTPTVENSETQQSDFVESIGTTRILSFENDGDIPNQISEDSGSTEFDHNSPMQVSEGATPSPSSLSAGTSARGRQRKMSRAMAESVSQREFYGKSNMHYMASRASMNNEERFAEDHDQHLSLQERMRNPIAFHAEMMGDIMYFHQAIRQPDAAEFVNAVVKEINGHIDNNRWQLVKRSEVPEGIDVIPSVWSMRRKRNLTTNEITKHKARLNIHGGKQVYGVNYFDTYAPVVTWFAIRLLIVFSIIYKQALRQVDFVQAYPQAPIETDMYMELPQGVETKYGNSKDHVLKLLSNLYGQKQAGRVWNQFMVEKLLSIGFKQSLIDECVFYRDDVIFIVYVDDGIFLGSTDEQLVGVIQEIQDAGLNVEDQGHPADYVGVNIKRLKDGSFEFTQRALIDAIIDDVQLGDAFTKPVPAKVSLQLHSFYDSPPFDLNFNYRSVVGKLNYLAQTTRPDIMYAVHQIAKYSADPRKEHGEAILYLARYLKKTRHLGLKFKPDESKGFDCYCDADFSGNWNSHFASADPSTAKSRSGWIIFYAGCPIIWASKLQSQVALSTTEAEYIALSMSLRDVIPIMQLIDEMKERKFPVICTLPHVYCKVFEDNSGALELAKLPKLRPRTKHINVCYHHFREHVRKGLIKIFPVDTEDQIADALTKALAQNLFIKHRAFMCGS